MEGQITKKKSGFVDEKNENGKQKTDVVEKAMVSHANTKGKQ